VKNIKIGIAADHAGYFLKEKIKKYLITEKFEIKDFGCFSDESVDYPDFGHSLAIAISDGDLDLGISVCATGNGINMTVNKHRGTRGALCWNEEISRLARAHNDANVCSIPGRFVSESEALLIVKTFIATGFDGGRHKRRIDKIPVKIY
jgi:ribose 5-phosphate isomerase B